MTPTSALKSADKREAVLEAALKRISQYGYRRTSMDDIAQQAGVSRPALYLHFRNKEDIFRTLSRRLHDSALARAEAAFDAPGPFLTRLRRAFEGWSLELVALVHGWPHAEELLDTSHRIGAGISSDAMERFEKLLTRALRTAAGEGEIELRRVGLSAPRAAKLLALAARGLKDERTEIGTYRQRIDALVRLFDAATRSKRG